MIHIPISRSLKAGSPESCLFINVLMGEVMRMIHSEHNLGFVEEGDQTDSAAAADPEPSIQPDEILEHSEYTSQQQQTEDSSLIEPSQHINRAVTYADDV